MKSKLIPIIFLFFAILLTSCKEKNSKKNSNTRIDGAVNFYHNFDQFQINLGGNIGSHRIRSVTLNGSKMKVSYTYKNGVLRGDIEPNGSYTGTYSTSSTSGRFDLRFQSDGTAFGSWSTEGGLIALSGSMAFEK